MKNNVTHAVPAADMSFDIRGCNCRRSEAGQEQSRPAMEACPESFRQTHAYHKANRVNPKDNKREDEGTAA